MSYAHKAGWEEPKMSEFHTGIKWRIIDSFYRYAGGWAIAIYSRRNEKNIADYYARKYKSDPVAFLQSFTGIPKGLVNLLKKYSTGIAVSNNPE